MKNQEPNSKPEGVDEQQREAVLESTALFGVTFKLEIMDADGIVIAVALPYSHGTTVIGEMKKAHAIMEYLGKCLDTYRRSSPIRRAKAPPPNVIAWVTFELERARQVEIHAIGTGNELLIGMAREETCVVEELLRFLKKRKTAGARAADRKSSTAGGRETVA